MATKRHKGRTKFTCGGCSQHKKTYRFAQEWTYKRHMKMWHNK